MPELKYRRARLYESLRTAHLERAQTFEPASIVHLIRRYDFDEQAAIGLDIQQAPRFRAAYIIARARLDVLEINEPLMLTSLRTTALALAFMSVLRSVGRKQPLIVTYAIGNTDPFDTPHAKTLRSRVRRMIDSALAAFVWRRVDKIVYGTEAARAVYRSSLPSREGMDEKLILPLPHACDCPTVPRDPNTIVFLGALAERKGFSLLMSAWSVVRADNPDARLKILGKGALQRTAEQLAAEDTRVSISIDPPRSMIHAELNRAQVLVLPSQQTETWREQVGLPILEGLAHGCSIVTTTQTGLAPWLSKHGHSTIHPDSTPDELASALVSQLRVRRLGADVKSDLGDVDGRLTADRWLFAPKSVGAPNNGLAS